MPQIGLIWALGPVQNPTNPWAACPAGRLALSSEFVANSAGNRPPPQPILGPKLSIPGAEKPKKQGRDSSPRTPTVAKLRAYPAPTHCLWTCSTLIFLYQTVHRVEPYPHKPQTEINRICSKFTEFTVLHSGLPTTEFAANSLGLPSLFLPGEFGLG